jgi:hypothetical protein
VEAMNKTGKLIQMGNQRRSMPNLIEAVKQVREGIIGNVYMGKAWYANNRKPIGYGKKYPCLPRSILICGRVPLRAAITKTTWFTTTGTGSGIGALLRPATTARMN